MDHQRALQLHSPQTRPPPQYEVVEFTVSPGLGHHEAHRPGLQRQRRLRDSPMRFEVMRRVKRSPSSARPVSPANTSASAGIEFFIVESSHSEHKKRAQPRAAPHFTSIYRIPNRTPQMGHASQLYFSPRILCLQEIPRPSALDTEPRSGARLPPGAKAGRARLQPCPRNARKTRLQLLRERGLA